MNKPMLQKLLQHLWLHLVTNEQLQHYQRKELECDKLLHKLRATTAFLEQYQDDCEELEKQVDEMESQDNGKLKLEKELKACILELDQMKQLDKIIKIDFDYLDSFEPTQIKALINLISNVERQVVEDSLTIRVVEWIAHRDGAVRWLKILKANLQKILKEVKKPKQEVAH